MADGSPDWVGSIMVQPLLEIGQQLQSHLRATMSQVGPSQHCAEGGGVMWTCGG
jgi:hypothetical protein